VGVRLIYRVFALSIFVLTVRAEIFFFLYPHYRPSDGLIF